MPVVAKTGRSFRSRSRTSLAGIRPCSLRRSSLLGEASVGGPSGRYQIEAAIQSAHVARRLGGASTWPAIVAPYDNLLARTGSPIVALNRAVAIAETGRLASRWSPWTCSRPTSD